MPAQKQATEQLELCVAEDVALLLDYASRVVTAIEDGNWHYAADKLHGLAGRVESLQSRVNFDTVEQLNRMNKTRLWQQVGQYARHYRLGQLLFPGRSRG